MAAVRSLSLSELRAVIRDPEELAKGLFVFDSGGLYNFAQFQDRLFAEARGTPPYRVSITFQAGPGDVRARCTCMAARFRPICKHAAALLVAWSQAPQAFAVAEAPPPTAAETKTRTVKRGRASPASLLAEGAGQVVTLVRELGAAGVASQATDRAAQIRQLGENLREHGIRRLSGRTTDLAAMLGAALASDRGLDAMEYTALASDLLLTARRLERHAAGDTLADKHVEALIGKTWRKKDRAPVEALDLVEYAYATRVTNDGFEVRESRFIEIGSGEHFAEKQILPSFLAKRTPNKRTFFGRMLRGASGSVYPGFAPMRLELEKTGEELVLDGATLVRLLGSAQPSVGALIARFQDLRRDLFAPDLLPAAVRANGLLSDGPRLKVIGGEDRALFLPDDEWLEASLSAELASAKLAALIGDVGLDGALPTFFPLALVTESRDGLALRPLMAVPPELARAEKRRRKLEARPRFSNEPPPNASEAALAAGASPTSVALLEVREELAEVFVRGLGALTPRSVAPLALRLEELGLKKPAELVKGLVLDESPERRLDDFVRCFQALEVVLVRLLAAVHVDRAALIVVPGHESVSAKRVEAPLSPAEVGRARLQNRLSRYEAAVHHATYYSQQPAAALADSTFPAWADASSSPHLARALGRDATIALSAADQVLAAARGRLTRHTAVRVLAAVDRPEATARLERLGAEDPDPVVRRVALDGLLARGRGRAEHTPDAVQRLRARVAALGEVLLTGARKDLRIEAARGLAALGQLDAAPLLRLSLIADAAKEVQGEAAAALALLGDYDMVEVFIRLLEARGELAPAAAKALGLLGDARALEPLRAAAEDRWRPQIVGRAQAAIDPAAIAGLTKKRPRTARKPRA